MAHHHENSQAVINRLSRAIGHLDQKVLDDLSVAIDKFMKWVDR